MVHVSTGNKIDLCYDTILVGEELVNGTTDNNGIFRPNTYKLYIQALDIYINLPNPRDLANTILREVKF